MSADSPVTAIEEPKPVAERERAKDYQLETIAQLSTLGTPTGTIAAVTGLSEPYVERLLSGKQNKTFNKLRERYQETNLKNVVGAHFSLVDLIPQSLQAFTDALTGQDIRLRKETGQWIWDRVVPDLNGRKADAQGDSFQITINQPHVQAQISETIANVSTMLGGLRDAISQQDEDKYVKLGEASLPIPPSQLEVEGGAAVIDLESKKKSDLLTELIEEVD